MNVLVAGGTGLVGSHLVKLLAADEEVKSIKLVVRKAVAPMHDKIQVVEVNFTSLQDYATKLQADVAFCCLGTTIKKAGSKANFAEVDYSYPLALAKMLLDAGCRQYNIITAMGADAGSMFFYNRVKGQVEDELRKLPYGNLNIFRPSLLVGERQEYRFGEKFGSVVFKMIAPFMIGSLRKYRSVNAETVAHAMLNISKSKKSGIHIYDSEAIQQAGSDQV